MEESRLSALAKACELSGTSSSTRCSSRRGWYSSTTLCGRIEGLGRCVCL